ncbi:DUF3332 family protein [Vibrio comitans]|uniref:DUF3332 domain-containing protein n=1 Tax=Vibrio comitans NBRC 102076 TaxID=1219078 RepID=A0A4Y3II65_9VIBR|nr:DUF3332 family protein [Vibrio comitans]GEA59107.1 hypothetical protein VCO01S_03000 [Vibrio comitans NBRC 102076]
MKKLKKTLLVAAVALSAPVLSGCVGSNFVTKKLMEFNIKVVDNRYARGGVNFLLAPVYGFTTLADYFVVNSIEFWTGKNPFDGTPHIFDSKVETYIDVNGDLDPSLTDAPIDPISYKQIEESQLRSIDENTIEMEVTFVDGTHSTLLGVKQGSDITFSIDGEVVSTTSIEALESAFAQQS